jgi:hypothetical protein
MAAPPNPLSIDVSLAQGRSVTQHMRTRGGRITATAPDGTRFTLTIPRGALPRATEITLTPVAAIKNLPLGGGLVAAVHISPEDMLFSQAPTLVVAPPKPIPPGEQTQFASFAYRGNGREFHLYPMETDPSRIAFRLLHLGGFGVGRGTEQEQEAIRAHLPTNPADRLMMQMQKLKSILRGRRLAQRTARRAPEGEGWRIVRTALNTTEPQPGRGENMAARMKEIINRLRDTYHQEVIPKLKGVRLECRSNMLIRVREAVDVAQGWQKQVDLFGLTHRLSQEELTSEETEMIIRDRVAAEGLTGMDYNRRLRNFNRGGLTVTETEIRRIERERLRSDGYTEQEVEDVLKEAESIRAEFQPMYDALSRLIWETLKKAYDKAHQCCMQEAKDFYLSMMDWLAHVLAISGQEESVSMEKRDECLCALQSVSAGPSGAWRGEITHTESYEYEKNEDKGSGTPASGTTRSDRFHKKSEYRTVINLVYHLRGLEADGSGSRIPAQVTGSGRVVSSGSSVNRGVSSSMDKRWGAEWKEDYSGKITAEELNVHVNIRPDGTYTVLYTAPCIEASGARITRNFTEGSGFPEFQKKDKTQSDPIDRGVCPTQTGVLLRDGQFVGIKGELDPKNPKALSGTKTFQVPLQENREVNKKITIKWNLTRCK